MYLPRSRFTRFSPGLDGDTETTCDHVAVQTARSCRIGGSRGGHTRMDGCRPS